MKKIIDQLLHLKAFLATAAIIAILGFTAYQISLISVIAPTRDQVEVERKTIDATRIKFDTKTIEAVIKQNEVKVNPGTRDVGKTDPFF